MEERNVIITGKKKTAFEIFVGQFKDLLVIILIIAAIISAVTESVESTIVIFIVLLLNAIVGTIQEVKAIKSLESLKSLSAPKAKLIKDGRTIIIDSEDVKVGDRLLIEAGDMIVADGRIDKNYSVKVNESALTGESVSVEKTDDVYSGTYVTFGRAEIVVTKIGMNTEIGKIAAMLNNQKERKTPLQIKLDNFSKKLAIIIMAISVIIFGLYVKQGFNIFDSMMFAVAVAVAAIPEALGSIVTIVQAIGTSRMAKENTIIRNLNAVETLGCVSVICSDKTGTLTQNKMTVKNAFVNNKNIKIKVLDMAGESEKKIIACAILANDSEKTKDGFRGEPTEVALMETMDYVGNKKYTEELLNKKRIAELPFDSTRKMMSVMCENNNENIIFTKGAPDYLIDRCEYILTDKGVEKITSEHKEAIEKQNRIYGEMGQRVIAFAYKETSEKLTSNQENSLIFIGLMSMIDPPREQSKEAVKMAKEAGIKPIMITGDNVNTARAIAKDIGIYQNGDEAVDGQTLKNMSEKQLEDNLDKISVYARVSPSDKIRIVKAWQKKGYVTAMTGDGVNDAPSLKSSDIGVGMGSGTEVAKDASDMVIVDDNFSTIIKAVSNGRSVYRNIINAIVFLMSGNLAAIISIVLTSLMGLSSPFTAIQLLFINLVTDSLPALAIGMEKNDDSLLKEKPRSKNEEIVSKTFLTKVAIQGALISIVVLTAYFWGLQVSTKTATTYAFVTLIFARLFHGFNCRSKESVCKIGLFSNMYTVYALLTGVILVMIISFVPGLNVLFGVYWANNIQIIYLLGLAFIPTLTIQIFKMLWYI